MASDLVHNMDWRAAIARAYIEQGVVPPTTSIVAAEERVVIELDKIRQVFEDVGSFMDRIETFRDRLERRVRMTVHYMDMVGEGAVERLARLIEKLGANDFDEVELQLRSPDVGFPITERALYVPPPPRGTPEKSRFKLPPPDPYLKAYIAATSEFEAAVRVTPSRLRAFIDEKMTDRDRVLSSEISIESIQDLFAFRFLPMAAFGKSKVFGPYRVVLEEGRTDNEWISLPAFRIERLAADEAG